jgi:hypothetical protein
MALLDGLLGGLGGGYPPPTPSFGGCPVCGCSNQRSWLGPWGMQQADLAALQAEMMRAAERLAPTRDTRCSWCGVEYTAHLSLRAVEGREAEAFCPGCDASAEMFGEEIGGDDG